MNDGRAIPQPAAGLRRGADPAAGRRSRRLSGTGRREQLLETAAEQFTLTGLHGTTTAALAKAAGITEPVLYQHFESKERLFREAVERNIASRLRIIEESLASIPQGSLTDTIEGMAAATVAACVSTEANAVLTCWALLEASEYGADLHRSEVGETGLMWGRLLIERFPELRSGIAHMLPFTVHTCLAYGFRLAAFRHTPESAGPLAREFAAEVAVAAAARWRGFLQSCYAGKSS